MRLRRLRQVARRLAPELPTRRDLATLALYVRAARSYIAIGVFVTDFLLSFWVAAVYVCDHLGRAGDPAAAPPGGAAAGEGRA